MAHSYCIYTIRLSDQIKSVLRAVPCPLPFRSCRPAGKTSLLMEYFRQELSVGGVWDVDILPYSDCSSGYWSDRSCCTLKGTVVSGRLNVIKCPKQTYQIMRTGGN
jgi:hypothetical protein